MADRLKEKQIPKCPMVHSIHFFRDTLAMHPKYIHSVTLNYNSNKTKVLKLIKRAKFIKKFLDQSSLKETISLRKHSRYLTFLKPAKYDFNTLCCFPKVEHIRFNVQLLQHWKLLCSRRNIVSLTIENNKSDSKKKVLPTNKMFFSKKLEYFEHMLKRDRTLKIVSIQGEVSPLVTDLLNTLAKSLPCLSPNLRLLIKSGFEWPEQGLSKGLLPIVDSITIKKKGSLMDLLKGSGSLFQSLRCLNITFKDIKKIGLYVESFSQLKCLEILKCEIKSLDFDETVDFLKKFTLPKSIKKITLRIAEMDWGEEAWAPSWKTKVEDSDKEVIEVNSAVVQKFLSRWDNLDSLDSVDIEMNFATAPKLMSREIAYKIMRKISPKKFKFKADTDDDLRSDVRKGGFDKRCLDLGMVLRDAPNFFKRLQELTLEVEGVNLANVPPNLKLDCPKLQKIDLKLIVVGIEKLKNLSSLIKAISNNKRPPGTEPDDDDEFDFEACEVYVPNIEVLREVFEALKTLRGCKGMLTFDAERLAEQSFTKEFLKFAQELDGKLEFNMHFFFSDFSSSNMRKIGEVLQNDKEQKFMIIDFETKSGSRFGYFRGGGYTIEDER